MSNVNDVKTPVNFNIINFKVENYKITKRPSMKAWWAITGCNHFKPQFVTLAELKPKLPSWREIFILLKPPKWLGGVQ